MQRSEVDPAAVELWILAAGDRERAFGHALAVALSSSDACDEVRSP